MMCGNLKRNSLVSAIRTLKSILLNKFVTFTAMSNPVFIFEVSCTNFIVILFTILPCFEQKRLSVFPVIFSVSLFTFLSILIIIFSGTLLIITLILFFFSTFRTFSGTIFTSLCLWLKFNTALFAFPILKDNVFSRFNAILLNYSKNNLHGTPPVWLIQSMYHEVNLLSKYYYVTACPYRNLHSVLPAPYLI